MELKDYQTKALDELQRYLEALHDERQKRDTIAAVAATTGIAIPYAWDQEAWKRIRGDRPYHTRSSGAGHAVPNICLKVPTGGGKTVMAVAAIDLINQTFRKQQTGLVLWVVPTAAIYRQTLHALRDRAHPYRQMLDLATGDRVQVLEKDSRFNHGDTANTLSILLLMLPSANRENKDTLRLFKDQGGFDQFFPPEDSWQEHAALLEQVPNLDSFDSTTLSGQRQIKTSLGNALRTLAPLIVVDEGHKAYSPNAQATLYGFNPCFVLELSATPQPQSNNLVEISGRALHREGMIKLDINMDMKAGIDWHDVLSAAVEQRDTLEQAAVRFGQNGGDYIRPICLVQVQRTGAKQRRPDIIHAEDAREFLIQGRGIPPEQIAVKSAERDDLGDTDLLAENCPVRYIITRQALQEGWDCSFAYVLAVLANSEAATSLTQLVGRVLRQPYGRKTKILELDECYVICAREGTQRAIEAVHAGLKQEGLSDLSGRINIVGDSSAATRMVDVGMRPEFRQYAGRVYLPCFVMADANGLWREIHYEVDILSRIDWEAFDLAVFDTLELNPEQQQDTRTKIGIDRTLDPISAISVGTGPIDTTLLTRQLIDVIPNPWVAFEYVNGALERLRRRFAEERIRRDLGFVLLELKKTLSDQRIEQAKTIFYNLIATNMLRFYLIAGYANGALPERIRAHADVRHLTHTNNAPLQRSLFDYVPEDDFNGLERSVALYLDQQKWVLAWYRNAVKLGYSIQGWQKSPVYPDFVALQDPPRNIFVLETKGNHLDNPDTAYKQALFDLCNSKSEPYEWDAIQEEFPNHNVHFQVVFEDEWERVLNAMFQPEQVDTA